MTDTKWREATGVSDDIARVTLICDKNDKQQWEEEADEQGYSSRSKHLQDLIREARAMRERGFLSPQQSEKRIRNLQNTVHLLKDQLDIERKKQSGRTHVDDDTFLRKFLSEDYKSLTQIVQEIVESGSLDTLVRKRVESQLHFLSAIGEVEHKQGEGYSVV